MNLATLVASETSEPVEAIMFLRHGNDSVAALRNYGATVEEFTAIQPIASKYDYFHPRKHQVSVVVVIVEDHVYGVFKILRIEATGTNLSVASQEYRRFDSERGKPTRKCHKFLLQRLSSVATGLPVHGWEGRTRTPVQRSVDSFFAEVEIGEMNTELTEGTVEASFSNQVQASLRSAPAERQLRLAQANDTPARVPVTSFAYVRNPDVVAEVLSQANGACQRCRNSAPFNRRSDGTPYLEVHHRVLLAKGGKDTVANAIALCPNCHREAHYGDA